MTADTAMNTTSTNKDKGITDSEIDEPPIIDLSNPNQDEIIKQIANACTTWGFFQIINHNVDNDLIKEFQKESMKLFKLSPDIKNSLRRTSNNSRGYFDDELTKQRYDWKQAIDIGIPGSRNWNLDDVDPQNANLDGYNKFPSFQELPNYRPTIIKYYKEMEILSDRIAKLMAKGLLLSHVNIENDNVDPTTTTEKKEENADDGKEDKETGGDGHQIDDAEDDDDKKKEGEDNNNDTKEGDHHPKDKDDEKAKEVKEEEVIEDDDSSLSSLISQLRTDHTSYLRTNYYPPYVKTSSATTFVKAATSIASNPNEPPPLGISPHKDAGFLTILLQDDDCHSLQVAKFNNRDGKYGQNEPDWITVHPAPNAFTINTGDMAMIWSNGHYKAPLHRVLTSNTKERISAPFFYNPGFTTIIQPLPALLEKSGGNNGEFPVYNSCCWGYFRAVRFAGDYTNIGIEIQISDFLTLRNNPGILNDDDNDNNDDDKDDNKVQSKSSSSSWLLLGPPSPHLKRQDQFLQKINFKEAFNIDKYKSLLTS